MAPIDGQSLRIILCTDIQGHTAMMQTLGDHRGREVLREHERITRELLAAYGGSEVKTMGDGFLASFGSAQRALQCAIGLQRALADSPVFGSGDGASLRVRIGLNAGEPIEEDDDIYGTSVIAAARIAAMAQGGEILVSNVVRELAAGKGFLLADRGPAEVRGLEEPVRLYELHWAA
jgi:class 3 adenylate cyclase